MIDDRKVGVGHIVRTVKHGDGGRVMLDGCGVLGGRVGEKGVVQGWHIYVEGRDRWGLGLASSRWRVYPYSRTLIPILLAPLYSWFPSGSLHIF